MIARFRAHIPDAAALLGAGLVSWGAYEIYRPAGFIVAGLFVLAAAILTTWKSDGP